MVKLGLPTRSLELLSGGIGDGRREKGSKQLKQDNLKYCCKLNLAICRLSGTICYWTFAFLYYTYLPHRVVCIKPHVPCFMETRGFSVISVAVYEFDLALWLHETASKSSVSPFLGRVFLIIQ